MAIQSLKTLSIAKENTRYHSKIQIHNQQCFTIMASEI